MVFNAEFAFYSWMFESGNRLSEISAVVRKVPGALIYNILN